MATRGRAANARTVPGEFRMLAGNSCFGVPLGQRAARAELEAKGVEFLGDTFDTGACHMAFFRDPDGNDLMLHSRYAAREAT